MVAVRTCLSRNSVRRDDLFVLSLGQFGKDEEFHKVEHDIAFSFNLISRRTSIYIGLAHWRINTCLVKYLNPISFSPRLHISYSSTRALLIFKDMPSRITENGAAFAAIHDYCRVKKIDFDFTAVPDDLQNATTWTASVILHKDETKRYVAEAKSKRAALSAAARMAQVAEGIVLSDSSEGSS
ncbi:hypothetical protein FRB95_014440 [Tulasnella sp. JGI-2019a]|nr:hypothetical protein FRB95_014440 [Tulasnella sp. JGI-2019a]